MAFATPLDDILSLEVDGHYTCMASRIEKGVGISIPCARPVSNGNLKKVLHTISSGLSPDIDDPEVLPHYVKVAEWLICAVRGHRSQVDKAVDFWKYELKNGTAPQWVAKWERISDSHATEQRSCDTVGHRGTDAAEEILDELSLQHSADDHTLLLLRELGRLTLRSQWRGGTRRGATPRPSQHQTTVKRGPETSPGKEKSKDALRQGPEDGASPLVSKQTVHKEAKVKPDVGDHSETPRNVRLRCRSPDTSSKQDGNVPSNNTSLPLNSSESGPAELQFPSGSGPVTRSRQAIGHQHTSGIAPFCDFGPRRRRPRDFDEIIKTIDEDIKSVIGAPLRGRHTLEGRLYVFTRHDLPGLVKIGATTKEVEERLKQHKSRCKVTPILIEDSQQRMVPNVFRLEKLVKKELVLWRKHERECQGCGGGHNEWFELDPQTALESIERWRRWIERKPYNEVNGMLKPIKLEEDEKLSSSWIKIIYDGRKEADAQETSALDPTNLHGKKLSRSRTVARKVR